MSVKSRPGAAQQMFLMGADFPHRGVGILRKIYRRSRIHIAAVTGTAIFRPIRFIMAGKAVFFLKAIAGIICTMTTLSGEDIPICHLRNKFIVRRF